MQQHNDDGSANAEWLALRAGKFSGSRFGDLMAKTRSGPSASRANLIATLAVERITGTCVETYQNAAMARGNELEPEARAAYEIATDATVNQVAWIQHPTMAQVGCSPDGIIVGAPGMLEIKCPSSMAKHLDAIRNNGHVAEYWWQLQGQLFVSGMDWVDAVSYDPRWPSGLDLVIARVERDEKAIAELEAACIAADAEVCALVEELTQRRAA
jgi:putative phage-type endonuclease